MLNEIREFWAALSPKIRQSIKTMTQSCIRRERYDVSTAPNGEKIGVRQPYGSEIFLPYAPAVAGAEAGDTVMVEWRDSLSTGVAVSFGDGIPKCGELKVTVGTQWSGTGPYTQQISAQGMQTGYTPIPSLDTSAEPTAAQITAFKSIAAVMAGQNSVTIYASAATDTEIKLILKL